MKKINIGIVGCGAIGSELAQALNDKFFKDKIKLIAICDIDRNRALQLSRSLKNKVSILSLDDLIKKSDFVIEAASKEISGDIVKKSIRRRKDILVMSVGGLLNQAKLFNLARKNKCRIFIPSGALCGIDGLKSASVGRIDRVKLTTCKPSFSFREAPFVIKNNINLVSLEKEKVIFSGTAEEAVEGFPQNINVAALLSLAGIGAKHTRVKIIASPYSNINSHEVEIEGEFGRLTARTDNLPSASNPKTSRLAIFSAIAMLKGIFSSVKIGT